MSIARSTIYRLTIKKDKYDDLRCHGCAFRHAVFFCPVFQIDKDLGIYGKKQRNAPRVVSSPSSFVMHPIHHAHNQPCCADWKPTVVSAVSDVRLIISYVTAGFPQRCLSVCLCDIVRGLMRVSEGASRQPASGFASRCPWFIWSENEDPGGGGTECSNILDSIIISS